MKAASSHQYGFTLIEIVMVLVLLGILASVAVPKYFDYQDLAEQRAALATVAEAQARLEATFGEKILEGMSCNEAVEEAVKLPSFTDDDLGKIGEYQLTKQGTWLASRGYLDVSKDGKPIPTDAYLTLPVCENSAVSPIFSGMPDINKIAWDAAKNYGMKWQYNSYWAKAHAGDPTNPLRDMINAFKNNFGIDALGDENITWAYNATAGVVDKANVNSNRDSYESQGGYAFWTTKSQSELQSLTGSSIPVIVYDTKEKTYSVAKAKVVVEGNGRILQLGGTRATVISDDIKNNLYSKDSTGLTQAQAEKILAKALAEL